MNIKKINPSLLSFDKTIINIKNCKIPFGIEKPNKKYKHFTVKLKLYDKSIVKKIKKLEGVLLDKINDDDDFDYSDLKIKSSIYTNKWGDFLTVKIPVVKDKISTLFFDFDKQHISYSDISKGDFAETKVFANTIFIKNNEIIIKWKAEKIRLVKVAL